MIVVLAEKPSVARDIARVLKVSRAQEGFLSGNGYAVTWALGHLVTQCEPDEIDEAMKKWRMEFLPFLPASIPNKVLPSTKKQFQIVKKLLLQKDTEKIICATDAGREGELIFRRIYHMAGCTKPVDRLWISSMTDEAIRQGFAHLQPMENYDALYQSALCRSDADYLVGINGSRAFTLCYGTLLSVGRVQTPTLSLLVQRRKEIESFVPETYYEVEASFVSPNVSYKGTWTKGKNTRIAKKEEAEALVQKTQGKKGKVVDLKKEEKRISAPQLYDLTALQQDANRLYGLTAAQTLACAQNLYEKYKVLTYPRTDSRVLPKDMEPKVREVLQALPAPYDAFVPTALEGVKIGNLRLFNDAKVTDHHALIPTGKRAVLPEREGKVFDLVLRRFLSAFYPPCIYEQCLVTTQAEGENFVSMGKRVLSKGFTLIENQIEENKKPSAYHAEGKGLSGKENELKEKSERKKKEESLPEALCPGYESIAKKVKALEKATTPPKPYTEATLLSAMENAGRQVEEESLREAMKESGLGTPATRASIIERLLSVGYVQRKGRSLLPTDKGVSLLSVIPHELASPETTGRWEKGLNHIRTGEMEPERFMASIRKFCTFLVQCASQRQESVVFEETPYDQRKGAASKKPTLKRKTSKAASEKRTVKSAPEKTAAKTAVKKTGETKKLKGTAAKRIAANNAQKEETSLVTTARKAAANRSQMAEVSTMTAAKRTAANNAKTEETLVKTKAEKNAAEPAKRTRKSALQSTVTPQRSTRAKETAKGSAEQLSFFSVEE